MIVVHWNSYSPQGNSFFKERPPPARFEVHPARMKGIKKYAPRFTLDCNLTSKLHRDLLFERTDSDCPIRDGLGTRGIRVRAYTRELGARWGVIASGAAVFGSFYDVKQFSGTAGAKFNFLTGRVRPYATGQAGYSWQSSNGMYANDHHPPLKPNTTDTEDGFTYRLGAGLDIQMSRRISYRLIQWDVQPQDWAGHTPFYNNFSTGISFRF